MSIQRRVLYEKFGNKCVKILKFWKTELSYAQNKNRSEKMRLLGMDTCSSLNDIMEIRCADGSDIPLHNFNDRVRKAPYLNFWNFSDYR
jgi:hypothetical protein